MKNYCEICGNNKLVEVLNLGRNPLCDNLIKISSKKKILLHKIVILFCNNCLTGQQKYPVKKKNFISKELSLQGSTHKRCY